MAIEFHGIEVQEECTQLVTSEIHWQKILRTFIASKRIENCSPGTLERYNDCVVKLVTALNKRLQDITTNDIRYYLAMYQEQRKISMSYMDTIRRYLSSFFAWISDEGYISRNPMRRLKKIKVPTHENQHKITSYCRKSPAGTHCRTDCIIIRKVKLSVIVLRWAGRRNRSFHAVSFPAFYRTEPDGRGSAQ